MLNGRDVISVDWLVLGKRRFIINKILDVFHPEKFHIEPAYIDRSSSNEFGASNVFTVDAMCGTR